MWDVRPRRLSRFLPHWGVAPAARADVGVTYEVVSGSIHSVNLEYYDGSQPIALSGVPLPWRTNAMVLNPKSQLTDGARLRVNWQPPKEAFGWVTIRIFVFGSLICESTQTKGGMASCYGDHPSLSGDLPARRGGASPEEKVPDAPAP